MALYHAPPTLKFTWPDNIFAPNFQSIHSIKRTKLYSTPLYSTPVQSTPLHPTLLCVLQDLVPLVNKQTIGKINLTIKTVELLHIENLSEKRLLKLAVIYNGQLEL